jgi:hypothetical protein
MWVSEIVGNEAYLCTSITWKLYGIKFTCVYHLVVMDVVAVVTAELFTVNCNVMIFLILTDGEILN